MKLTTFSEATEKGTISVNKNTIIQAPIKYVPIQNNSFFDIIEKFDHKIKVPHKIHNLLKGHSCICEHLIISSFLPTKIKKKYNNYTFQKNVNGIITDMVNNISSEINKHILEKLKAKI